MGSIRTYSGSRVDPFDLKPEDIRIEDIAASLSKLCRFLGHGKHFISVAEHSFMVSHLVHSKHALAGLLHDGSEAYLQDIPSPIKATEEFAGYRLIEDRAQQVIFRRFGLPYPFDVSVHEADKRVAADEAIAIYDPPPTWVGTPGREPYGIPVACWDHPTAREMFLRRYHELTEYGLGSQEAFL